MPTMSESSEFRNATHIERSHSLRNVRLVYMRSHLMESLGNGVCLRSLLMEFQQY